MNIEIFEKIIHTLKIGIKNTEFENNLYIHGGYLRNLFYKKIPTDLDLVLITNSDHNIFLNLILNSFNLEKFNIQQTDVNIFKLTIYNINVDLKIFNNLNNLNNLDLLKSKLIIDCDFTINLLIKNISTNSIVGLHKSTFNDLSNKLIRPAYDLDKIFRSSPQRIFRLIRFYSIYDFNIPKSILSYIKKNSYLINFVDKHIIIGEYNKILKGTNGLNAIKLLNILNIDPTNINRFPIFFGDGWFELEPGKRQMRVTEDKKYKWCTRKAEIIINDKIEILKLNFIKNPNINQEFIEYYYDDNYNCMYKYFIKNGENEILINVKNNKKITIITDVFIPCKCENTDDIRELGLCLTDCKIYKFSHNKNILIEHIPYLLKT